RPPSPPPLRRRSSRANGAEPVQTRVTSNSELFDRILARSFSDLRMLRSRLRRQTYFAAGIPWFATVFGRDTLITALELLAYDGIPDERGRQLATPIALAEAQGYVMRAKRRLARLFGLSGQEDVASRLRQEAVELRERLDQFWLEGEGFYSMALDGRKRPSRALGSNQGHLLWSLAVPPQRAAGAREALMRPEMFSGWGILSLGSSGPCLNSDGHQDR